ncbi:Methionine biosynthesis protein MetW [uncultured archaeon]|nr:Methionine biosynthesis protein MetW [uncultured archaeon]
MDTFEIQDEEIDVEEIMRNIKENIKRRKECGAYPEDLMGPQGQISNVDSYLEKGLIPAEFQQDFNLLNSNWDIQNDSYYISSHRPIAGKLLTMGRELVHGEVKRYVDPMIGKQTEFNRSTARILSEFLPLIYERIRAEMAMEIESRMGTVLGEMREEIENKSWLAKIIEKRIDLSQAKIDPSSASQETLLNYLLFEERFRGTQADIKQKQSVFVHYFDKCKSVLDIGCGRGEFLELLQEKSIGALGIDIDKDMLDYCRSRGLKVQEIDAVSYLQSLDDESLDGIFIDQVIEHLEPDYLIKMLGLCYKKIKLNSYIILETVNPLSLFSFINFYIDMSHKKPVHPETLRFLLESAGFREIRTEFFATVSDDMRLKKIDLDDNIKNSEPRAIETYNRNIDMLNNILYGAQDYVAIGKR